MWGAVENPFRPGVGHAPPYFVGRQNVLEGFAKMISGEHPPAGILLTGHQGLGKTALLEQFVKLAESSGWIVASNSFSEASSLSEERVTTRIISDLARAIAKHIDPSDWPANTLNGNIVLDAESELEALVYDGIQNARDIEFGDASAKLKQVLAKACALSQKSGFQGLLLAYDEAQFLDGKEPQENGLTTELLNLVASVNGQPDTAPCILILSRIGAQAGHASLNGHDTATSAHKIHLDRLTLEESYLALSKPIKNSPQIKTVPTNLIYKAAKLSAGHPYLVQIFGKALFDDIAAEKVDQSTYEFPSKDVIQQLETGFFAALWNKTTVEQQEFLRIIAEGIGEAPTGFSQQDAISVLRKEGKPDFGTVSRLLDELCTLGLLFQVHKGKFAFTVPMSIQMIQSRLKYLDEIDSWSAHPNGNLG